LPEVSGARLQSVRLIFQGERNGIDKGRRSKMPSTGEDALTGKGLFGIFDILFA
jgi:hypothetical protein